MLKQLTYPVYRDEATGALWKFNGTTFWSYDDPQTLAQKLAYVQDEQLGGVMIWSLDGDTSDGELMRAIHSGWRTPTAQPPVELTEQLYVPAVFR